MKKHIPYGIANYEELVAKDAYFVDKTPYIEKLEQINNPAFMRPKRFGKSLFCRMLECYYNIRQREDFPRLFGKTYIGEHPTPLQGAFIVLHLDFSIINASGNLQKLEAVFNRVGNLSLKTLVGKYNPWFRGQVAIDDTVSASENLQRILNAIEEKDLPLLYVIIDEYDNFSNHLILSHKTDQFYNLMAPDGFLKTFFKTLKEGRKQGTIANVFITGVLPMAMDEIASGFNIVTFLTLRPAFDQMVGFTQAEVNDLLDKVYADYGFDTATRGEVEGLIRNHYNGYRIASPDSETLYNPTILLFFLDQFCSSGIPPRNLTDVNVKTDLDWIKVLTGSRLEKTIAFVNQLTIHNRVRYDDVLSPLDRFNVAKFFSEEFFPISFFYLGLLTREDDFYLTPPNLNMRTIFVEYFNELHRIGATLDHADRYAEIMQRFLHDYDFPALFAGYWAHYVSQLPEAIFVQVNENFYRTTFYELCRRYLSRWFIWHVERSYPKGRSDLEFVGKYHERFAGERIVIEFKYYSNAECEKLGAKPCADSETPIVDYPLQEQDTRQIAGYVEGLRQEYPEARVSQYVVYCFGNMGFRVFSI